MKKTLLSAGIITALLAGCGDPETPEQIDFNSQKVTFYDPYMDATFEIDTFDSLGNIYGLKKNNLAKNYWYNPEKTTELVLDNSGAIGSNSYPLPEYMVKRLSEFATEQKELQVELAYLRHEMDNLEEGKRETFAKQVSENYFNNKKNKDTLNTQLIENMAIDIDKLVEDISTEYSAKLLRVRPYYEKTSFGSYKKSDNEHLLEFGTSEGNALIKAPVSWTEEGSNYAIEYQKYEKPIQIENTNSTIDGVLLKMNIVRK